MKPYGVFNIMPTSASSVWTEIIEGIVIGPYLLPDGLRAP
jgi:hypothetical protein